MTHRYTGHILASLLMLWSLSGNARADDLKLLAGGALKPALDQLLPEYERSTAQKVTAEYGSSGAVTNRVQSGAVADVAIVSPSQVESLQKQGLMQGGPKIDVAKIGIGVAVPKGASKPDLTSVEALKQALLAAPTIAYMDPAGGSPSGIYLASAIEKLGIAGQVKAKTHLFPSSTVLLGALAKGEVAIALTQLSEIIAEPTVGYAGPLPAEIQNTTFFAAGVVSTTKQPAAAKALAVYLASPAAREIFRGKGLGL
jgi:molybdate transport system substrate-binding protein